MFSIIFECQTATSGLFVADEVTERYASRRPAKVHFLIHDNLLMGGKAMVSDKLFTAATPTDHCNAQCSTSLLLGTKPHFQRYTNGHLEGHIMPVKEIIAERQTIAAPTLVSDVFEKRIVLTMELALSKACEMLDKTYDTHEYRRYIAAKIIDRVSAGERTFEGMVEAGMVAIRELRHPQENV